MKILYISNSRIPTEKAHGIQIMKMCEAFGGEKVELELVLPTRKNKIFKNTNIFEFYNIQENFSFKKIFTFDPVFLMKLSQGIYIKVQALFFIFSLFFFLLFKSSKKEYTFYTRDEYLLPMLQIFSKKVVWEGHNLPRRQKYYLKYWNRCHEIVVISGHLKEDLVSVGVDENKILIAHDGVDIESFNIKEVKESLRQKLGLPQEKKIVMYVGHFYEWKGVQVLADAAKKMSEHLVVFVGGGDHRFEDFKKKNNFENILYTDYKRHSEIPDYLKAADVLVLPNSKKDVKSKHTSPLKLFEYMSSGTLIVASDLENFREVLSEENAVFFEPDNSVDLVQKIQDILGDEDKAKDISEKAEKDVKNYTWQKRAQKIINFINS